MCSIQTYVHRVYNYITKLGYLWSLETFYKIVTSRNQNGNTNAHTRTYKKKRKRNNGLETESVASKATQTGTCPYKMARATTTDYFRPLLKLQATRGVPVLAAGPLKFSEKNRIDGA